MERGELGRRPTHAGIGIDVAVRAERPERVSDQRSAGRQIELRLVDRAARAARVIRSVPGTRLDEGGHRPLQPIPPARRGDVDDPTDAERRGGGAAAWLDLDTANLIHV